MRRKYIIPSPLQVFMGYVKIDESGCWLWIGVKNKKGYGQYSINDRPGLAHRKSWTIFKGEIPNKLFVCHKCDVTSCVNPEHLFLGTNKDNMKDMATKGRHASKKIIKCPNGHPYDTENTYLSPANSRHCRTCSKRQTRIYLRRLRGVPTRGGAMIYKLMTKEIHMKILDLINSGVKPIEVAKTVNRHRSMVWKWKQRPITYWE